MLTTHDGRITAAEQAFIDQVIAQRSGRPGALLGILESVQNRNPHKYLPQDTLRYIAPRTRGRHLRRHWLGRRCPFRCRCGERGGGVSQARLRESR